MTVPTPPRLPIPNGAQLTVRMLQGGQACNVVLGGLRSGGVPVTSQMGVDWLALFWSTFRPGISTQVSCTGATVRDVSGPQGVSYDVGPPSTPGGDSIGSMALAAASIIIQWRTETGGRSGRGRSFIPGVPAQDVQADGRTLQTSAVTTWKGRADTYRTGLIAGGGGLTGLDPAVLSFTRGQAYEVVGSSVPTVFGVQRRRMRG